jgi:tungstate transport system substrate-binding protein
MQMDLISRKSATGLWTDQPQAEAQRAAKAKGVKAMKRKILFFFLAALSFFLLDWPQTRAAEVKEKNVILSTTTSTQDSGLLEVLVPIFEKQTGYSVKTISVGTGQALALAAKGDADVALVHAPSLEKKYVGEGKLLNRRLVMYNDFVIIGPKDDPAKIKSAKTATGALKAIEQSKAPFVSRGDNSGTHNLEKSLWQQASITPKGAWYIESGQGMGATLGIANERNAYTITDRGTYLALGKRVTLPILIEGDRLLLNIYSVIEVNPANGPRVNAAGGKAFADFMASPQAQAVIESFGVEKFGQPLFVPVSGKREEELGV